MSGRRERGRDGKGIMESAEREKVEDSGEGRGVEWERDQKGEG